MPNDFPFNLSPGDPCPVPDCGKPATEVAEDAQADDGTIRRIHLCLEHKQNLVSDLIRRKQADDPGNPPWATLDEYWAQVMDPDYMVGQIATTEPE